ncbi:MAG: autotransporter-associated beta strand repeat-containing protein [Kiritimatiellae bacterium]|nr:autotransporter-associated beta strand repeat-containing protein [Kiritimatiellia bacterium]
MNRSTSDVAGVRMLAALAVCGGMAAMCHAANVTDSDTSWWSLSGGVLTLDNGNADISSSTNVYTAAIGLDVAKIVKTGPGAVRLSGNNPNFQGEIDVQAGILMGWVREKTGSTYTEDNYGRPSKVTVAEGATFEMLATPIANAAYSGSRFGEVPTQFYVRGTGLNGMGALRRHSVQQLAERSYATIKALTLQGPTMLWVGMRWGFNGSGCVLEQNGHPLTLKCTSSEPKTFNFCREGQTEIRNHADIILDYVRLCTENGTPKNNAPDMFAGSYMVITNSAIYQYLAASPGSASYAKGPLYWDIKSYGGCIEGPNVNSATAAAITAVFGGNLELCNKNVTYLYNYNSTGPAYSEFLGEVNGVGTLSTQHASNNTHNRRTVFRGGGAGHRNTFARLENTYGTVVLQDADRFTVTNGINVGGSKQSGPFAATLVVTNTTLFMQPKVKTLTVGNSASTFGVLDIRQGAVVTNDMQFGAKNKGAGALYLSGNAKLYWHGGSSSNPFLGIEGCAYAGMRDDALWEGLGWFNIGQNGSRSLVYQRGGTFRTVKSTVTSDSVQSTTFKVGRTNGIGLWYQGGGTLSANDLWFTWDYPQQVYNSHGSYTIDGPSTTAEMNDICYCISFAGTARADPGGQNAPGTYGTVNVSNGGTLTVNRIYKTIQPCTKTGNVWDWNNSKDDAPNTWAWLNFDGGVLKVKGSGDFFSPNGAADDARLPTRVTVYAGGATIDTNGRDSTWRLPLERPYGKGVASITLANSVSKNANYVCPPAIRFDGDGSNVTAIVDFDEALRTNRGVIVTCPGFGFTSAPTVKIEKEVCDNASFYTDATVEMVDFDAAGYEHGGLTKRGAGTLTLTGANTYGGTTRLEGGTLAFTNANGYPGGDLEIAASAVQSPIAAPLLTASALAFAPGKGVRVTAIDTLDATTFGRARKVVTFASPLAELPSLTLVASDGTVVPDRGEWKLSLVEGGRTLAFGANRGLRVLVR